VSERAGVPILKLPSGVSFLAGGHQFGIEPVALHAGDWVVLSPDREDHAADEGFAAARVLATLAAPQDGTIELFGTPTQKLDYMDLLHLRARLGFVPGHGGLLANRSLRENIALPISVHGKVTHEQENAQVDEILARFDLADVSALRPHQVEGPTRFRTCVARALALSPAWLVIEGIGAFEADTAESTTWRELMGYRARGDNAAVFCLGRRRPLFEDWFAAQGGRIMRYSQRSVG
jgi:ABC-type arginine transport system ATPase subunit